MTELSRPDPSWLAYIARRVPLSTPGRSRVALALLADPRRSNRAIASAAGTDHMRVMHARHELENAGVIPVYRAPSRPSPVRPSPVRDRVQRALLTDPFRTNREIAEECGTSHPTVIHTRHAMEAAGLIAVYRAPSCLSARGSIG